MITATNEQVGVWFRLMLFCHDQENLGTIVECRSWHEKIWERLGLSSSLVFCDSPLWHWRGTNLVVHLYDKEEQAKYERMVKQRRFAANTRWNKPPKTPGKNGSH